MGVGWGCRGAGDEVRMGMGMEMRMMMEMRWGCHMGSIYDVSMSD